MMKFTIFIYIWYVCHLVYVISVLIFGQEPCSQCFFLILLRIRVQIFFFLNVDFDGHGCDFVEDFFFFWVFWVRKENWFSCFGKKNLQDRMMKELHAQGKTIEDVVEVLKRAPIHPRIVPAIKAAHALGYI